MLTRRDVLEGLDEVRGALQWRVDNGYQGDRAIWRELMDHVMRARIYLKTLDVPQMLTLEQADRSSVVWLLQRGKDRAEPIRVLFVNADALLVIGMGKSQFDMLRARDYKRTWVCWNMEPRREQALGMRWEDDGRACDDDTGSSGSAGRQRELAAEPDQGGTVPDRTSGTPCAGEG